MTDSIGDASVVDIAYKNCSRSEVLVRVFPKLTFKNGSWEDLGSDEPGCSYFYDDKDGCLGIGWRGINASSGFSR